MKSPTPSLGRPPVDDPADHHIHIRCRGALKAKLVRFAQDKGGLGAFMLQAAEAAVDEAEKRAK